MVLCKKLILILIFIILIFILQLSSNAFIRNCKMPTYNWKFQEYFNDGNYADVLIEISTDNPTLAKNIVMNHIIKMSRFGIPKIVLTSKGKTAITHSNDVRASNLPYIIIDYALFQKILCLQPNITSELNHMASPFIPGSRH